MSQLAARSCAPHPAPGPRCIDSVRFRASRIQYRPARRDNMVLTLTQIFRKTSFCRAGSGPQIAPPGRFCPLQPVFSPGYASTRRLRFVIVFTVSRTLDSSIALDHVTRSPYRTTLDRRGMRRLPAKASRCRAAAGRSPRRNAAAGLLPRGAGAEKPRRSRGEAAEKPRRSRGEAAEKPRRSRAGPSPGHSRTLCRKQAPGLTRSRRSTLPTACDAARSPPPAAAAAPCARTCATP
jgi:hypothetical protein